MTPAPSPLFGGRGNELRRVATSFENSRTVVLSGRDGIGKTRLAVEFAHRYGSYFPGGVYWLSFAVPEDVSLQVAACGGAGALDLRADFAELALDDQLHLVLGTWQEETPRLLLFDDCEEEEVLREWLPAAGGARVLVTSRRSSWDPALRTTTIPVGPLPRDEAAALLRSLRPDVADGAPILRRIAEELEDMPLALRLAAGFLQRYRGSLSLDSFLEQLRSREVVERAAVLLGEGEPV